MRASRRLRPSVWVFGPACALLVVAFVVLALPSLVAAEPQLTLTPLTDTNPVGTTHTLTATITPASPAQIVRFNVSTGPNEGDGAGVATNSLGQALFSYLGDGGEGTDVVVVWVDVNPNGTIDSGEPVMIALKTWTVAAAAITALVPETDTNPVGTSHQLTATVTPPQSGVLVRFRVLTGPNAGDTFSDATNSSGIATASYVGDGAAGTDLIIAWADLDGNAQQDAGEPALAALKTWTSGSGTSFSLSPVFDTNPIRTRHDLTATLSPAQSGVKVRFEVLSGPNVGVERDDSTNSSGVAQVHYTDANGPGTDTIIAWADFDGDGNRDSGEPSALATMIWTSTGPVTSISLAPASDSNAVGTSHGLTATVAPVQSGVTVRFEVISGPNSGTTRSDLTNSSGVAEDSYVGSGGTGTDTIVAWADLDLDGTRDSGEPFAVATKTWTGIGPVVSIALAPASDSNPVGTNHQLTATIVPAQSGVTVRFEVVFGPNSGTTRSDGTNSSGVATARYRGAGGPGVDTVIAWADLDRDGLRETGEPSAVATTTWTEEVLGTFISGIVPRSGVGLIVWGGGSTDLLVSASACGSATPTLRFWVSQITGGHGEFIVFIPASQVQLVNARWFARFPTGFVPSNTILLATCGR